MCGIAGVFGASDAETVRRMLAVMRHRGPDDSWLVSRERFSLGAVRLSILDVAGGRQPLANETGTVWAAQNGELYNFPALRPRLLEAGHRLRTTCDTEVLPHLYEDHGTGLPERIDGMFAVAVWDDENGVGLLARDRPGKKPLYYVRIGEKLYFGSEIKCLLQVPGFRRRIDHEALHQYLSLKHVPCPRTIFEGLRMLPPAHRLVYRPGRPPRIERYWTLDFREDPAVSAMSEDEAVDRLLALLRKGVERRFMADVPVGFYLSGGIDSSLTTALAAEAAPGRVKTFTLTYGDAAATAGKRQDRKWASFVSRAYGTEHHEETIGFSDFPESLRRVLRHFDEPFAGVISTFFLAELIARHVKVAVSGDGADELFGSYLTHRLAFPIANYPAYRSSGDASLLRPFEAEADTVGRFFAPEDRVWRGRIGVFSEREKRSLYTPDAAAAAAGASTERYWRRAFDGLTARDPLNRILEAEFRTVFPDQVLAFVDRLSMAHSLEVRTAFLDTDVMRFVAALPGTRKIRGGVTKHLLKRAAARYFPREMVERPKEGFLMPIAQWMRNDLESYVRGRLSARNVARAGVFDAGAVRTLVDDLYADPAPDHFKVNKVYTLLVFQEWFDLFMA